MTPSAPFHRRFLVALCQPRQLLALSVTIEQLARACPGLGIRLTAEIEYCSAVRVVAFSGLLRLQQRAAYPTPEIWEAAVQVSEGLSKSQKKRQKKKQAAARKKSEADETPVDEEHEQPLSQEQNNGAGAPSSHLQHWRV